MGDPNLAITSSLVLEMLENILKLMPGDYIHWVYTKDRGYPDRTLCVITCGNCESESGTLEKLDGRICMSCKRIVCKKCQILSSETESETESETGTGTGTGTGAGKNIYKAWNGKTKGTHKFCDVL